MTSSSDPMNIFVKLLLLSGLLTSIQFRLASTTEVELRRSLFQERTYDPKVCPEPGITKVHTNLILLQIESVNEKQQVRFFSFDNKKKKKS